MAIHTVEKIQPLHPHDKIINEELIHINNKIDSFLSDYNSKSNKNLIKPTVNKLNKSLKKSLQGQLMDVQLLVLVVLIKLHDAKLINSDLKGFLIALELDKLKEKFRDEFKKDWIAAWIFHVGFANRFIRNRL